MKKYRWIIASALAAAAIAAALIVKQLPKSKQTHIQPDVDGGVKDSSDPSAPKSITSRKITAFDSSFYFDDINNPDNSGRYWFQISKNGSETLVLSVSGARNCRTEVDTSLLDKVQNIIERHELVKLNGISCVTQGLPVQYSPCSMFADYSSGEHLSFTTDSSPEFQWCFELKDLFFKIFSDKGYPGF